VKNPTTIGGDILSLMQYAALRNAEASVLQSSQVTGKLDEVPQLRMSHGGGTHCLE